MGDRFVESGDHTKNIHIDAKFLYGWSMSQYLPYKGIQFTNDVRLILETVDCPETGYFVEIELKYPDEKKKKQRTFPSVQ